MPSQFNLEDFKEGQLLLFDKPYSWTSFRIVGKTRWLICKTFKIKKLKVGHAGTLDPLATGLLLVCTGKFTKRIHEFMGMEKEYTGTFHFGATTPSYDLETSVDATFPTEHLTPEILKEATQAFIGDIDQHPPIFSAVKKDGKRLYEYARQGEDIKTEARNVHISVFELTRIELPEVDFRVVCGKGTYIRSLAHDFGKAVGSGAHLSALRRTRIGKYRVEDALTIESFTEKLPPMDL